MTVNDRLVFASVLIMRFSSVRAANLAGLFYASLYCTGRNTPAQARVNLRGRAVISGSLSFFQRLLELSAQLKSVGLAETRTRLSR